MEKNKEKDIDKVSGIFGKIVGEIFAYQDDIFKEKEKITKYIANMICNLCCGGGGLCCGGSPYNGV